MVLSAFIIGIITANSNWFNNALDVKIFTDDPNSYNLGSSDQMNKLSDIATLSITIDTDNIFNMKVFFQDPKNDKANFKLEVSAPIEKEIIVEKDKL